MNISHTECNLPVMEFYSVCTNLPDTTPNKTSLFERYKGLGDYGMGMSFIAGPTVEGLPISEAVRAGDFLFVSGMCGFGENGKIVEGGVAAETKQIFSDLRDILQRAGTDLSRIAKVTVYLTDAADFDAFNEAYAANFTADKPARIGIVAGMTIDARIEMDFVAYLGN